VVGLVCAISASGMGFIPYPVISTVSVTTAPPAPRNPRDVHDSVQAVQNPEQSNQGPASAAGSAWIWAVVAIELAGSLLDAMQSHVVTRPMPIR